MLGACASLVLREWVDASIVLVIVAGSTMLGFYQEYRASKAVAELKERLALTARVLRSQYRFKPLLCSATDPTVTTLCLR